jgi:5-methylcytosine-specific restriction endonuclease McrA
MNYQRIHDAIIDRARTRMLQDYCERHHVIPRCLGGLDIESNLVKLTAREHFIVHKLLCEIYPNNKKLHDAVWCMIHLVNKNHQRGYIVSNREYEYFKILRSNNMSILQQGHSVSKLTRDKISKSLSGRKLSDETKNKLKKPKRVLQCMYCKKIGGAPQMHQWHFDNCKFKT